MKLLFVIFLALNSVGLLAQAESPNREVAIQLMKALNEKEIAEDVPEIHRSEIIENTTPSCNTILMLHGLYESKNYLKGITQYFLSRNFNVVHVTSAGHFRPKNTRMENVSFRDWKADARLGLKIAKNISSNVFVFGYSTGGTMASDLALNFPEDVKGLVYFAPALMLTGRTQMMVSTGKAFGIFPMEKCNTENLSRLCKVIGYVGAGSVENSIPLLKEGLSWSPLAGVEVYKYTLSLALNTDDEAVVSRQIPLNLYIHLIDTYKKITAPVFMAVDEDDLTIHDGFAQNLFSRWTQTKSMVLYSAKQGIAHTNIVKYKQDTYKASPDFYNKQTDDLERKLDEFFTKVNPTCQ